jgi:putative inorganic carbon (hco3(-)) transporter
MHFGLEPILGYLLYIVFVGVCMATILWRPIVGIFFLLPMIPLQTLRYRMNDLPLGGSAIGIVLLCIVLGLLRRGQSIIPSTPWTKLICVYGIFTFVSLCLGSVYLNRSLPLPGDARFGVWQEYIIMPVLLLLVAAIQPSKRQMQAIIIVMCLSTFALDRSFWGTVSDRDFSTYSEEVEQLRDGGSMGYAGTNGLAAFEAQVTTLLFALAAFEKKKSLRYGYQALGIYSAICLMYSFSRGGYVAFLVGWLFLGIVKQRKLFILLVIFLFSWTAIVPPAVQQRVLMTYDQQNQTLDHSAETRISLWEDAINLFNANPVMGTGYNTYAYMNRAKRADGGEGYYADTHNFYLKVLVENGLVGLLLFLWLVIRIFSTAIAFFRRAQDPFFKSLGLGLAGWLLCSVAANCFGDRWTYVQVNGYMWVLAGMVAHASLIDGTVPAVEESAETNEEEDLSGEVEALPETAIAN